MLTPHRLMVGDSVRVAAFQKAIHAVVKPGSVVVDLGTGTGLLAFFACQAGARKVYAIEREQEMLAIAEAIARANGWADRVTFLPGHSTALGLPERADVVISETIGHFGLEEQIIHLMADASTRFLAPGGILVPSSLRLFLVPVESSEGWKVVEFWENDLYSIDFRSARRWAASALQILSVSPDSFLAEPRCFLEIDLAQLPSPLPTFWGAELAFSAFRPGILHGLAGWFEAELAPGHTLSTSPLAPATVWQQAFFPLEEPISLSPEDQVNVSFGAFLDGRTTIWSWRGQVKNRGGIRRTFEHSTFPCEEITLAHRRRARLPKRTPLMEAALEVLQSVDDAASLEMLTHRLLARFPHRYASKEAALADVLLILRALQW